MAIRKRFLVSPAWPVFWIAITLVVSGLASQALFASVTGSASLRPTHIKVVCSTSLFVGVDRGELTSSANLWLQTLGKREDLAVEPEVMLADDVHEIRNQVDDGTADLVASSSLEYLAMNRSNALTPEITMTPASSDKGKIKYLLLVNRDGGINSPADLNGKTLNTYSRSASNLNRLWLEVLLQKARLSPADRFFRHVTATPKPSTACLPIFFGKADACLLDSPSWDTLRDLNPQLEKKLKVLEESQPLLESLISMRANRQQYRTEIIDALLNLQNDPQGRQVLLFFKCSRAVGINAGDLQQVADLRSTYLRNLRPTDKPISLPALSSGSALKTTKGP